MDEIHHLEQAIAALDAQRTALGDQVVDAALATLRQKLDDLRGGGGAPALLSPRQGFEERKLVSVLFADLVGFTALSEHTDPEEMREVLNTYLQQWQRCIEDQGGMVEKFIGDAVMAVFGLAAAREDDPQRAIAAALCMQKQLTALNQDLEQTRQIRLAMRVGVHSGPVVVSTLGERTGQDFVAVGDTVNLASRLQTAAPENGILISLDTYRLVTGYFDVVEQQPVALKGKSAQQRVFLVTGERVRSMHTPRGIQGVTTRMIGRESEFERLQHIFENSLRESRTWLVTITGDPGIGKTRLLLEFQNWLIGRMAGVLVLRADADQSTSVPYGLLRSAFARWCGILGSDTLEATREKLERTLEPFFGDTAPASPLDPAGGGVHSPRAKTHLIGALLGFDFSASSHLRGVHEDLQQLRKVALIYLGELFTALSRSGFVLVCLDDIHWADQPSLEAIQSIAQECPGLRLLIVCLARQRLGEIHREWKQRLSEASYATLWTKLKPLSRADSARLFAAILQTSPDDSSTLEHLVVTAAEGNPYYLEEIVKMVMEDGVIQPGPVEGSWQVDQSRLETLRVPTTLTAVIQARLDSLKPADRSALQGAAMIGYVFWDCLLQTLLMREVSIDDSLLALEGRTMIRAQPRSTFEDCREYQFNQNLLREVVYETVLKRNRRSAHRTIAGWIAQSAETHGRGGEFAALIAYHFSQAGELARAAAWYFQAGRHARRQGALAEARGFLNKSCQLVPPDDRSLLWEVLLERAILLGELGELSARRSDDQVLLALAEELGGDERAALAYLTIAGTCQYAGDMHQALKYLDISLEAAQRADALPILVLGYTFKIATLAVVGELDQAGELAGRALEAAEALGDDYELARTLVNLSTYYLARGDLEQAARSLTRQVEIARRAGMLFGESTGLNNLGYCLARLGQYEQALAELERARQLTAFIGAQRELAYVQTNLGLVKQFSGELDESQRELEQAIRAGVASGDTFGQAIALCYLSQTLLASGQTAEARLGLSKAIELFNQKGMAAYEMEARACLARGLLLLGDLAGARSEARQVWQYLSDHGGQAMECPALAYLACVEVFEAGGDLEISQTALLAAHQELTTAAGRIENPAWRQSYLENVPANRLIQERWKRR